MTNKREEFLALATQHFGSEAFKNADMIKFAESLDGFTKSDWNWVFDAKNRVGPARYVLPQTASSQKARKAPAPRAAAPSASPQMIITLPRPEPRQETRFDPNAISEFAYASVPDRDPHFVTFGDYKTIDTVVRSGQFFPVFISGLSGNGKTFMVEQACARAKRPMIRIQMSRETDEDDLIGGFRLISGETKFMKGPVLRAMELGALLLVDEADRADPGRIMCLQGILEGKPYYVKKTGEIISGRPGFNIIVTANTKGRGSDDGRYVAASVLDDAWLERFPVTIEQSYPSAAVETKILESYISVDRLPDQKDMEFVKDLVMWSDVIRRTYTEGAIEELVSTRRLVHIVRTYLLFDRNEKRAIEMCVNRFDVETRNTFLELFSKIKKPEEQPSGPALYPLEDNDMSY